MPMMSLLLAWDVALSSSSQDRSNVVVVKLSMVRPVGANVGSCERRERREWRERGKVGRGVSG